MKPSVELQNIEAMRRREGIDDVELREAIRRLQVGHFVKVTLMTGAAQFAGETVLLRITSIRGPALRGKLVHHPAAGELAELPAGAAVAFTTAHIHSLAKGPAAPAPRPSARRRPELSSAPARRTT